MVRFKFFIHCDGWIGGGYENTHFAKNKREAKAIINQWNKENPGSVTLLSVEEITHSEYKNDRIS